MTGATMTTCHAGSSDESLFPFEKFRNPATKYGDELFKLTQPAMEGVTIAHSSQIATSITIRASMEVWVVWVVACFGLLVFPSPFLPF